MAKPIMRIEGLDRLMKRFGEISKTYGVRGERLEPALMKAARFMRSNIQTEAPVGPTGNLRRSVVAKKFSHSLKDRPAAFCAIDYRTGPHAHLVEYGTSARAWKSGKSTGIMPANPFFTRGFLKSVSTVNMILKREIQELLKRTARV